MKARTVTIEKEYNGDDYLIESVIVIIGKNQKEVDNKMGKAIRKILKEIGVHLCGMSKEEKEELFQDILDEGMFDPFGYTMGEYCVRIVDFPFNHII